MDMLRGMALFVRIVDKGSITRAADDSGLTPTMIGNHLRALEEHLGMKLLHRTTRQQQLTDFGLHYYERCLEILSMVQDAETVALEAQAEPQGRLRLSFPHAFGLERLMAALRLYMARYPKVDVEISFTDRMVDLLEEGFEAAVRIGELPSSNIIARRLHAHPLVLCAAPDYLARRGTPVRPQDMQEHDCITYRYANGPVEQKQRALWRLHGEEGELQLSVRTRLQMDNGPALREAAAAGLGIVLLPLTLVEADLESGRLCRILPAYSFAERPLHLVYLSDRRRSPKLNSFIDFMLEHFSDQPR